MTKEEIANYLDAAHDALTEAGQAMADHPDGAYELRDVTGQRIPSFAELASAVRAQA